MLENPIIDQQLNIFCLNNLIIDCNIQVNYLIIYPHNCDKRKVIPIIFIFKNCETNILSNVLRYDIGLEVGMTVNRRNHKKRFSVLQHYISQKSLTQEVASLHRLRCYVFGQGRKLTCHSCCIVFYTLIKRFALLVVDTAVEQVSVIFF